MVNEWHVEEQSSPEKALGGFQGFGNAPALCNVADTNYKPATVA